MLRIGSGRRLSTKECFCTVELEKTLESTLDCRVIKPVNPKRNQSLIFIERTDAEFEAPILSLPDANSGLIGKHSDAGKNWEEGDWGRDGLMAPLIEWIWVWASSGWWWRTGKCNVLQSIGLPRFGHNWETVQFSLFSRFLFCFILLLSTTGF